MTAHELQVTIKANARPFALAMRRVAADLDAHARVGYRAIAVFVIAFLLILVMIPRLPVVTSLDLGGGPIPLNAIDCRPPEPREHLVITARRWPDGRLDIWCSRFQIPLEPGLTGKR